MLYIYIKLFGWRCANLAVATQFYWRAQDLANFSARKEDLPPQVPYKASQHGNSDGKKWDTYGISYGTIWASHSECWFQWEIWIKVCGTMWTYVNICEHHRWTSQNPQTLVSILIPLSLSLSMFWCFFLRFGPWHVQRLSDSSGSSIPKFHFSSFLTLKGRWQRRVPAWFLENISKNTCVILSELRWSQVHNWHTMMASAEDDGSGWDKDFATFSWEPGLASTAPTQRLGWCPGVFRIPGFHFGYRNYKIFQESLDRMNQVSRFHYINIHQQFRFRRPVAAKTLRMSHHRPEGRVTSEGPECSQGSWPDTSQRRVISSSVRVATDTSVTSVCRFH